MIKEEIESAEPAGRAKFRLTWWKWKKWPVVIMVILVFFYLSSNFYRGVRAGVTLYDQLFLLIAILAFIFFGLGEFLFSYLELSPDGIQYRSWPFLRISGSWEEVEAIQRFSSFGLFHSEVLVLKKVRQISPSVKTDWRNSIALSGFSGWPQGKLAETLNLYAPWLFDRMS